MLEINIATGTAKIPNRSVMACSYLTPYLRDIFRYKLGEISLAKALEQTKSKESAVEAIAEKIPAKIMPISIGLKFCAA